MATDHLSRTFAALVDARPLAAASDWVGDYARFWAGSLASLGSYLETLEPSDLEAPPSHPSHRSHSSHPSARRRPWLTD